MKLIYHDLEPQMFFDLTGSLPAYTEVISKEYGEIQKCMGCFACWLKTPGKCILKDNYFDLGKKICQSSDLLLITRVTYGGYSPYVKNLMDRSIGSLLPFLTKRNNEMHHYTRYLQPFSFRVIGYGGALYEKKLFKKIAYANAVNLDAADFQAYFVKKPEDIVNLEGGTFLEYLSH